jgi:hypothetical protein
MNNRGGMILAVRAAFALLIVFELAAIFLLRNVASDFTWLGLAITAAFVWAVAELFRLSAPILLFVLLGVIVDAASALWELYSRIEPWDLWIHAMGGSIIAAGAIELISRLLKRGHVVTRGRKAFITTGTYLIVATIGFLYEFLEYLVDRFQYGYPKSLVSAYDSIEDQVLNIVGATLVLGIYYLWVGRRGSEVKGL